MTPKVDMHCTVINGKSLAVPLNILGSVYKPEYPNVLKYWDT